MEEYTIVKLYGNIVEYVCPNCGEIMEYNEYTIEILKENGKEYIFCEGCDNKLKL